MEIKVEKGVPLPKEKHGNTVYPWDQMEVGDSFVSECPMSGTVHTRNVYYPQTRFKSSSKGGVHRVWRVK